jgi:pimeloyl-ACP methyl ester carboxylesterase
MAARPHRTALLARAGVRAIVIAGEADPLIPMDDTKAMAAAIPNGKLLVVPDTAHLTNVEKPAIFNDAVIGFVTVA